MFRGVVCGEEDRLLSAERLMVVGPVVNQCAASPLDVPTTSTASLFSDLGLGLKKVEKELRRDGGESTVQKFEAKR